MSQRANIGANHFAIQKRSAVEARDQMNSEGGADERKLHHALLKIHCCIAQMNITR